MKKIIKSVKFNAANSDEFEIIEHLKSLSFAPYVKRLIWADMKGISQNHIQEHYQEPVVEDINFMEEVI